MAYVEEIDYVIVVSHEEFNEVLTQAADGFNISNDAARIRYEGVAEAKIKVFLSAKYDIDTELAKTGTDRNQALVECYLHLALRNLYFAVDPNDIPEMREKNYDECIEMLSAWRDGTMSLPGVDPLPDGTSKREFVMPVKFISKPFADPLVFEDGTT